MTRRREGNYLWVTWLARLMAGEVSCTWATWFRTHYMDYRKAPSDFQRAVWMAQHTQLLAELVAERAAAGETTWVEAQGSFHILLRPSLIVAGKPDLVTLDARGDCVVYDVKTGKRQHSHVIQVMLYMRCLPFAFPQLRQRRISGCVVYREGEPIPIPSGAIDDTFTRTARYFVDLLASEAPPRHVPSPQECRYCDITNADCSQRIERRDDRVREGAAIWGMDPIAA